jgi:SAM-dependent methyltransferase
MARGLRTIVRRVIRKTGFDIVRLRGPVVEHWDPVDSFHSDEYLRHNSRRLEHLASLRISVAGMSVLEVGAGIGDHSQYYIDRGCTITITEARPENVEYLRTRYPALNVHFVNMERPARIEGSPFDVVHCYGLLYHLRNPGEAIEFLAQSTRKLLLLETCVSFGAEEQVNLVKEAQSNPTQAYSGIGCRPTRTWLFNKLRQHFKQVYLPKTQPWHEEFPLDWTAPEKHAAGLQRAIFIACHEQLENEILVTSLIMKQRRHE